jgi:hypothetical protein
VAVVDVDGFRIVNSTHGRNVGAAQEAQPG